MNKQEAIKKLESIKVIGNDALAACYNESINAGITLMKKIDEPQKAIAQLAEKWHEDIGPVLWWDFPVEEPPYCGTPLDDDFPKYKTHFTELRIPDEVEKEPLYRVKIGEGYFVEYQGRGALIMPDCNKEIKIFDSKSDAERTAQTIGGTVEEVVER